MKHLLVVLFLVALAGCVSGPDDPASDSNLEMLLQSVQELRTSPPAAATLPREPEPQPRFPSPDAMPAFELDGYELP